MKFDVVQLESTGIDVIDGDRGKNYPHQNELLDTGFCLFLSAKNVTKSGFNFFETKFISQRKDTLLKNGKLKRGDIVITTRGTVGNVALYSPQIFYDNVRINSGMLIIRCTNNISNQYLYQVLRSEWFQKQIMAVQSGSAQPQLPKSHFLKMYIPLPSLPIQEKIASILQLIDDKVMTNNAINNNLEQQAQLLFQSWFSNTNRYINNDWHIRKFGEVAYFSQGMQVPISKQLLFPAHGYERFIRIVDITQPSNQDIRYIESTDKGKVFASDIFMIRYGSPGIVARNYEGIIANNLFTIYPTIAELSNDYIYYYLKSNDIQKYIVQNAVSSTMPAINFSTLKNLDIIIPDRISMQRFTDFSKTVRLIQYNIKQENQRLAQLRDTLLPKLMSGELDVSDIDL